MTDRPTLLIVNPAARHGETSTLLPAIEGLLVDVPHETVVTSGPGEARDIAAAATDRSVIAAVGGDGTVHEVVNGLMAQPEATRPALGIVPTGSGNDTSRALGVPVDLAGAVRTLSSASRHRIDVGRCNEIYYINTATVGLDARVTATAAEHKAATGRSGLWLYMRALLHVLFRELYGIELRVAYDGRSAEVADVLLLAANNGPSYGGGFKITPAAELDDGLLDVCVIDPLPLPEALVRLPFVVLGRHTGMRPVHMSRHRSLVIEADTSVPAQIDGELLTADRFDIEILPGQLEAVVPRR